MCHEYIFNAGGDMKKLRDELLSLCDKLMEGDFRDNVHQLRYKIEIFSKSAIEQIKATAESKETVSPLVAVKKRRPSPAPPQPQTLMEDKMTKTEPASPSMITPTGETALSKLAKSKFCNWYSGYIVYRLQLLPPRGNF